LSFQPFLDGPGRINDYVKLNGNMYRIAHVEDFISPWIGYNLANNTWNTTVFNRIAARFDTGYRQVNITNVQLERLLQIIGISIRTGGLRVMARQPAKMTRWGAGDTPEGDLDGFNSPVASPLHLRNLYTVNEKPIQLRGVSELRATRITPMIRLSGFLYELEGWKKPVAVYFEPPIGGIE